MRHNTAKRILIMATILAAYVVSSGSFAQAGLTFSAVVVSNVESDTNALITVDVFGARDQGASQPLSTYGISLTSSAGVLNTADSTNAVVQNEWQSFVRLNTLGANNVVFRGGQTDPSSFSSTDIQLASSRIGRAVFTVQRTGSLQTVAFTLGSGPTRDAPARSGALRSDGTPGGYFDVTPLVFNSASANVSAVPEPSSLLLASLVLGVPYGLRLRRKNKASA